MPRFQFSQRALSFNLRQEGGSAASCQLTPLGFIASQGLVRMAWCQCDVSEGRFGSREAPHASASLSYLLPHMQPLGGKTLLFFSDYIYICSYWKILLLIDSDILRLHLNKYIYIVALQNSFLPRRKPYIYRNQMHWFPRRTMVHWPGWAMMIDDGPKKLPGTEVVCTRIYIYIYVSNSTHVLTTTDYNWLINIIYIYTH